MIRNQLPFTEIIWTGLDLLTVTVPPSLPIAL